MKLTDGMQQTKILAALSLVAGLMGCGTAEVAKAPDSPATPPVAASTPAAAPAPAAQSAVKSVVVSPLDDANSILAKRSVYFDYDDYQIHKSDMGLVEAHGKFMAGNKSIKVRLEGNADERGGREYNLALGQRRAEQVRKALTLMGAADASIEAVSNGKEKPVATGHDEAAWAQNRRVDIRYAGH